jgi:hypothetical protein
MQRQKWAHDPLGTAGMVGLTLAQFWSSDRKSLRAAQSFAARIEAVALTLGRSLLILSSVLAPER